MLGLGCMHHIFLSIEGWPLIFFLGGGGGGGKQKSPMLLFLVSTYVTLLFVFGTLCYVTGPHSVGRFCVGSDMFVHAVEARWTLPPPKNCNLIQARQSLACGMACGTLSPNHPQPKKKKKIGLYMVKIKSRKKYMGQNLLILINRNMLLFICVNNEASTR